MHSKIILQIFLNKINIKSLRKKYTHKYIENSLKKVGAKLIIILSKLLRKEGMVNFR